MPDYAIRCEHLSKQYRLGERESYKALRDVITDAVAAPFRRLRTRTGRDNVAASSNGSSSELSTQYSALAPSTQYSALAPSTQHSTVEDSKLETRNSKLETRNSFWALDDVSFDVQPGEVVGIIGRNGAGKSTLLKILSRITKPTKGHAEIHGRVGSLLEVGTGFHPELTGRENIYLNAAILGMRKAEVARKFDEIVAFAEVEKFIDTPVKRYSSGMYVRLAFAVAAHMETEILLIDEVLAVGDSAFQKKCLGRMDEVAKHGRTVLFVSHDMNAIQVLCEKSIHLNHGNIMGFGDTAEQITNYLSAKKNRGAIHAAEPVRLAGTVEISQFEFTPNPIISGQPVDFSIQLSASNPVRLDDICILIYSSLGRRLAIVDLRQTNRTYRLNGSGVECISGRLKSLPLVEGDYQIGLYLNWGATKGDFYDLLDLSVIGGRDRGQVVPYPASVRGVLELDYEVD